jgi:hypothetical protein
MGANLILKIFACVLRKVGASSAQVVGGVQNSLSRFTRATGKLCSGADFLEVTAVPVKVGNTLSCATASNLLSQISPLTT